MKPDPEPFSTSRPWDALTLEAYRALPLRGGHTFQLDETCSPAEIAAYRDWCKRFPRHWPGHVKAYAERVKHGQPR